MIVVRNFQFQNKKVLVSNKNYQGLNLKKLLLLKISHCLDKFKKK